MTDKELLAELKKRIKKYTGGRCKDFCFWCGACAMWLAYDILVDTIKSGREGIDRHITRVNRYVDG